MTGVDVPKHGDADDAVFMPGRNIVLIGLAAVWCSTRGVGAVAIGSLGGNPFPDATPEFFDESSAPPSAADSPTKSPSSRPIGDVLRSISSERTATCPSNFLSRA